MARRIQLRRDTGANWTNVDPVLAQGEVGVDLTTGQIKIGNGSAVWSELTYYSGSDIDLDDYATQDYVDDAINAIEIPSDIINLSDEFGLLTNKEFPYIILTQPDETVIEVDPVVSFVKSNFGSEIDYIDEGLAITRGDAQGIYNPILEDEYDKDTRLSPLGTEWNLDGWDDLSDLKDRTYETWFEAEGQGTSLPVNIVGREFVMHDIANDKYYLIKFTQWTQGAGSGVTNGGGFAYERQLVRFVSSGGIQFADGSVLTSATQIPSITGLATEEYVDLAVGAIEIPDVSDFITAADIPAIPTDINQLDDVDGLLGQSGSADTGDITFDGTTISAPDNATIVVAAQDGNGVTAARLTVDPGNKLAKLESSIDANQSFFAGNEYAAASWTVDQFGDGVLVFSNARELFELIDSSNTALGLGSNRTLSWNEGDQRVEYSGNYAWNGEINELTLRVGSEYLPPVDPTAVTVLILNWTNTSRISVDSNDNEEIQIFGRGIPIRMSTTGRIETAANGIRLYSQASEDSNIRLYAGDYVRIRTNDYSGGPGRYEWEFQDNGSLRMPNGGIIREDEVTENPTIELTPANPSVDSQKLVIKGGQEDNYHLHLTTGDLEETSVFLGTDEHSVRTYPDGSIRVSTYDYLEEESESKQWVFDNIGQIVFPDETFQYTAWAGGRVRTFAPGTSKGAEGDKERDIVFDGNYFYYCTADYTDGLTDIWKRVAWSNDTW
jgi:hypothetical protein